MIKKAQKKAKTKEKELKILKKESKATAKAKTIKKVVKVKKEKTIHGNSKVQDFYEALKLVLESDKNKVWIMKDEELLEEVNLHLEDKSKHICKRSFERYKKKALSIAENDSNLPQKEHELYVSFCRLIKKALIQQKTNLFNRLLSSSSNWQRFAWIIERKFDEWNLKHKAEHEHNVKRNMSELLDDLEKGKMDS